MTHLYETDGAKIYLASFATIRAEADLARFTPEEEVVAVRMIHASGMVDLAPHIRFAPGFAIAARAALERSRHPQDFGREPAAHHARGGTRRDG